jgi:transcriptional regulator with XRE-family HTH domain
MGDEKRRSAFPGFGDLSARRKELAGELVTLRQAAGLSQTEVAARMGTSQSAVARLESGAGDLRLSSLERYAAALGRQIDWKLT